MEWLKLRRDDFSFHPTLNSAILSLKKPTDYAAIKQKLNPSSTHILLTGDLFFGYESPIDFQSIQLKCGGTGLTLGTFQKTQLPDGTFYYWFCENQTAIPVLAAQFFRLEHEFDPPLSETTLVEAIYVLVNSEERDRLIRAADKNQLGFADHDGKHEFTMMLYGCVKREKTK